MTKQVIELVSIKQTLLDQAQRSVNTEFDNVLQQANVLANKQGAMRLSLAVRRKILPGARVILVGWSADPHTHWVGISVREAANPVNAKALPTRLIFKKNCACAVGQHPAQEFRIEIDGFRTAGRFIPRILEQSR